MNIDHFLVFWSAHNVAIIEVLIASILFAVALIAYLAVFGKNDPEQSAAPGNVDTAQIEKTLQKILETQSAASLTAAPVATPSSFVIPANPEEEAAVGTDAAGEVAQLRQALQEKQVLLNDLQRQLEAASAATAAGGATIPSGPAAAGMDPSEKATLETRIKDLEARLSEYEIISEDIADLSRYKEENTQLQKELDALKASASSAPESPSKPVPETVLVEVATTAPVVEATADATPNIEPAATAAPASIAASAEPAAAEASSGPTDEALLAEMMSGTTVPAEAAPATAPTTESAAESSSVIDDDLMKEFAAAVEGQKAAKVDNAETDKLMNDFENFIKKG